MALRRFGNPGQLARQPFLDLVPGGAHGLGALEYPRVGDDAQEGEQARPRKAYAPRPVQLVIEPAARRGVLIERGDMCVEEDIGIEKDHRNDSVSALAI